MRGDNRTLVIQNCATEGIGLYERFLVAREIPYQIIRAYRGEEFPPIDEYDLLIVGGTPICVRDLEKHEFLRAERRSVERALELGKPCVGICFGGQLLAALLGAEVRRNAVAEIGGYQVRLTAEGRRDPLLRGFPAEFPVFHWHGDTFALPERANLLVEGQDCKHQCFRYQGSVALQFHLEVTSPDAERWADAYAGELSAVGKTKEQVVSECRERESQMEKLAELLMSNLLESISRR